MTQLLLSVRNVDEARLAIQYPVGIVDLKDPSLGALGAVESSVRRSILLEMPASQPMSVALGELENWPSISSPSRAFNRAGEDFPNDLIGFQFAKIGLAGMANVAAWQADWFRVRYEIPPSVQLVAVAYVDAAEGNAPPVDEIVELLQGQGAKTLLLDTFRKDRGNSLQILGLDRLKTLVRKSRQNDIRVVIAGSITAECLPQLFECEPDYIGVRGTVCRDHRQVLDERLLDKFWKRWEQQLT